MELFKYKLRPANSAATVNFEQIEDTYSLFTKACAIFNQRAALRHTGKKILIEQINEKSIILTLQTSAPIASPGRALYGFSRNLLNIDESDALRGCIYNNCLFTITAIENIPRPSVDPESISDSELLKSIIDLLFANQFISNPNRTATILELKKLMVPYLEAIAASKLAERDQEG